MSVEKKKTVLIFGISSFVGSNLAETLRKDYRVVGTYYETPVQIPGIFSLKCDVHNKDLCQKVVFLFKPDITVYAVGLTDLESCQEFPKVADALNTAGVFNVSMASERYHSKFVYISSVYLFSGENIVYKENDTPMPTSVYGNTIASSEFFIQKSCLNYLILRCCPLYGRSYNPNDLKFIEVLDYFESTSSRINCDTKVHTGFLDVSVLGDYLKLAIEKNITNRLLQIDTQDSMTRYEFAKLYFEVFGGNSSLLAKSDWKFPQTENQLATQNLGDELYFKMDTSNFEEEFQIQIPSIRAMLEDYRSRISGNFKFKKSDAGISFI